MPGTLTVEVERAMVGVAGPASGAALVSVDEELRISAWCPNATAMFGLSPDRVVGTSMARFADAANAQMLRAAVTAAFAAGSNDVFECTLLRRDLTPLRVSVLPHPMVGGDGSVGRVTLQISVVGDDEAVRRTDTAARIAALVDAYGLSQREAEMLALLASGHRIRTMARALFLAEGTVRNTLSVLYAKLGVSSQQEVIELLVAQHIAA